jgi:Family of unknown function (DUF5990)
MSLEVGNDIIAVLKMKQGVSVRIRVVRPPNGVSMQIQHRRDGLLAPLKNSNNLLTFEFDVQVDLSADKPNFLVQYAQGPKDARFIYVNSGTYAGQAETCWSRRAKISLMSITNDQIQLLLATPGARLETSFQGAASDGGPTCASVKGTEWKVVTK